jgi:hypothetical protein
VARHRQLDGGESSVRLVGKFKALSFLEYGTEKHFQEVRVMIMEVVEIETENLKAYVVDETIAEHVTRLKNPGEWGGNPELHAANLLYKRNEAGPAELAGPRKSPAARSGPRYRCTSENTSSPNVLAQCATILGLAKKMHYCTAFGAVSGN